MNALRTVRFLTAAVALVAGLAWTSSAMAVLIVDDMWRDGNRTEPTTTLASGPHSENGVDGDSDGDVESRWYRSGTGGTMTVVNTTDGGAPNVGSPNILRTNVSAGTSASWTTYFTPDASPVTLAATGDSVKVTWVFSLEGVNTGSTTGTGVRLAVVNSPEASRVVSDTTPGSSTYSGYAMFMNMATTLGSDDPFRLHERTAPATSSALLSAGGSWTALADQEAGSVTGYADDTTYTFMMSFTRTASDGLDIVASMTGGSVGGDGSLNLSFTDTTPNGGSFSFDTFALRPSQSEDSAEFFNTSLFRVEFTAVPEVSSFLLVGLVGIGMVMAKRRRREEIA